MRIHRIYAHNNLRNYNYIIYCNKTRDAAVIDPLMVDECLNYAKNQNLNITKILNTHEHWDHIAGNEDLKKNTSAKIYAHLKCAKTIPNVDVFLKDGDEIKIGDSIKIKCIDSPGHTFGHICFYIKSGNDNVLFSGDTLFNAGVGNCKSGNSEIMYNTFREKIFTLPDETTIYPGHDYLENNLNFTLSIEPNNEQAKELLRKIKEQEPEDRILTTIGYEKKINTFFRLSNNIPDIASNEKDVFLELRKLRDSW